MSGGSGDIIIKGGSVEVIFDSELYPEDPKNPGSHKNPNRKITRIVISGDISYDSGVHPEGLVCEVRTSTT
jgi:hypothetical protein